MSNVTATFNINNLTCTLGGFQISGFFDDIVTIKYDEPSITSKQGCDGEVGRAINKKKLATATFQIIQTSATNDLLSATQITMKESGISLPFILKDSSGSTLVESSNAWIENIAEIGLGGEIKAKEWVLKLANANINNGGNNT
jgi:hypothetical protein